MSTQRNAQLSRLIIENKDEDGAIRDLTSLYNDVDQYTQRLVLEGMDSVFRQSEITFTIDILTEFDRETATHKEYQALVNTLLAQEKKIVEHLAELQSQLDKLNGERQ